MTTEQNKSPPRHTEGPWHYDPDTGLIHSLEGTLICDTCRDPDSPETREQAANGCLIDTAPDLLEGAEAAVAAFDNLDTKFSKSNLHQMQMAIQALIDAIATARRGDDDHS
jgi:hypothetical protein